MDSAAVGIGAVRGEAPLVASESPPVALASGTVNWAGGDQQVAHKTGHGATSIGILSEGG